MKDGSRPGDDKYFIEFSQEQLRSGAWMADRMYKIQLRLASESFENEPGAIAEKQEFMSEWSKVCLVCPIITPELSLTGFEEFEEKDCFIF